MKKAEDVLGKKLIVMGRYSLISITYISNSETLFSTER